MTLEQIKNAVLAGKKVHWASDAYEVVHNGGQWLICCTHNDSCIGLTWRDGATMNGRPEQFFIHEEPTP